MSSSLSSDWVTLWEMLFGYPPKDDVARGLEGYLDEEFPGTNYGKGWKVADLRDALRAYAEDARRAGHRPKPPAATEVKSALIRLWYERKRARDTNGPPSAECALCSESGLVTYCPDLEPPYSVAGIMDAHQVPVPCRCRRGQRLPGALARLSDAAWARLVAQRAAWSDARGG